MDLLLELIENEKMKISELSLAHVADQYLEFIRNSEIIRLDSLADFLSVASRLILIKSRSLLPVFNLTEDEEAEIKDLTKQLEEYKKFKVASQKIGQITEKRKISYSKEAYQGISSIFYPPIDFNVFDFKKYFLAVLAEIPIIEKLKEEFVGEIVTLEQKINDLQNTLRKRMEASFSEIASEAKDKIDVIVSFLAMLEMVKQRIISVEQEKMFMDIKMSLNNSSN